MGESSLINKINKKIKPKHFIHTSMVSHQGIPVSFAMSTKGEIFYSVLDLSSKKQTSNNEDELDKNQWSEVGVKEENKSILNFPNEISQVGYGVIPNVKIGQYNSNKELLDPNGKNFNVGQIDQYYSTTARFGDKHPFQTISDGKYIYVFRQSISSTHELNLRTIEGENNSVVVDRSLLVDRFILSGTTLKLSREVRFQRSRHKTEPESVKDTLSPTDIDRHPFYEPTRELSFAKVANGNFAVLLLPGADPGEQRWQIFANTPDSNLVNSFNIRFDPSIIFDTSDSQMIVDKFMEEYELTPQFITDVTAQINTQSDDNSIASALIQNHPYSDKVDDKGVFRDALTEAIYIVRTGVIKDDFIIESQSEWPLVEDDVNDIEQDFQFYNPATSNPDEVTLKPISIPYKPINGFSACYYHQQEIGADQKPMKTRSCVMLAVGLEQNNDDKVYKYIGIINFSVSVAGRISRFSKQNMILPDIDIQLLDESPYESLEQIANFEETDDHEPQRMELLDIDSNGLSTSGGVIKFAYTSHDISENFGYSDAIEATNPFVFDDSLGRVNLYFQGRNNNFFILYFNPVGSKSLEVKGKNVSDENKYNLDVDIPLKLKPRLDGDRDVYVSSENVNSDSNTFKLTMKSEEKTIEEWHYLPKNYEHIANILNGDGEFVLGKLDPLENSENGNAGYLNSNTDGSNILKLRCTIDNSLIFKSSANPDVPEDATYEEVVSLGTISPFLANNTKVTIANKSFAISTDKSVQINTDLFYKSYLSGVVSDLSDQDKLWKYLGFDFGSNDGSSEYLKLIKTNDQNADSGSLVNGSLKNDLNGISEAWINSLQLKLLEDGSELDIRTRRLRLKDSLMELIGHVASIRLLKIHVNDLNSQFVDYLEAGLNVNVLYDYSSNFIYHAQELQGIRREDWEHPVSYLFNATIEYNKENENELAVNSSFDYKYDIKNTIGQWEDWEASLALKFTPDGSNFPALYTTNNDKVQMLKPSEKGLTMEAWINPTSDFTDKGTILCYKNENNFYSLQVEKEEAHNDRYKCVAICNHKKIETSTNFTFSESSDRNLDWKHVAFTHRQSWGYQLHKTNTINFGNDDSLRLEGEFTIEILVKVNSSGIILQKEGEYQLEINDNNELMFNWGGTNYLSEWLRFYRPLTESEQEGNNNFKYINSILHQRSRPILPESDGDLYKITLIRTKNKPQKTPTHREFHRTVPSEEQTENEQESKWYEDQLETEELLKGLAEKQEQLEDRLDFSNTMMSDHNSMLGGHGDASEILNPKYYHTVIVTKPDLTYIKWSTQISKTISPIHSTNDLEIGSATFSGVIDNIRLWNRALSVSEASKFSIATDQNGLISFWRFSEGTGTHFFDDISENHGETETENWVDSPFMNEKEQFQFYIDGFPIKSDFMQNPYDEPSLNHFSIGGKLKSINHELLSYEGFKGFLEEIRIWKTPRTHEQIVDNAFGRLKGEWNQLMANYRFDQKLDMNVDEPILDASSQNIKLGIHKSGLVEQVLSTAPVATEIPQIRSALTGVENDYHGTIITRPHVIEYGDVQKNEDGTLHGILKRCYSFIDSENSWNRVTGYKVGNLVSQWYGQMQFDPQVTGYLEGPPPVPAENLSIASDGDVNTYAYKLNNSISFQQAEEVAFNYSTSKEAGWNVAIDHETSFGAAFDVILAPFGVGISVEGSGSAKAKSNWQTSGSRVQSYERGVQVNKGRLLSASLAGYDNEKTDDDRFYKLGNTGYALVKSKTADIYLLRLAHNDALVSISIQPNWDIPEDVNIIPFPINPLYTKQGTLDGKFGESTDNHYPQAHNVYGNYSYFKPREAYQLKKQIEREKIELRAYFEDLFDTSKTNKHFDHAATLTGLKQVVSVGYGGAFASSILNQTLGQVATQVGYNNTKLKEDFARMGSQRNLVNTYVWTVEGGFYAESTEVAETQQETFTNNTSLSLGGSLGGEFKIESGAKIEHSSAFSSGSSFTLTKSKTRKASNSFGLNVNINLPTSPRYKYTGVEGRTLGSGLIRPGTVDAYRFMSFYLEPKAENFTELFTKVIDSKWLEESSDPYAQALRSARGNINRAKPCWRIMHRVTYVSRVLPEFQPEAPPSLEKSMRAAGIESNFSLIKKFEPYVKDILDVEAFFSKIDQIIDQSMLEFKPYKQQIKEYLALYFNRDIL